MVTVLNRFGAVASADTHSRFLQDLSADSKAMLEHNLSPNAFCIVSVDNIDILQSHAQVYASDSHRSYHGTSIQCAEPLPKTCVTAHYQQPTDTEKRVHALTPSRSPSVLMEKAKRMRILQTAGMERPLCVSTFNSMPNEGMTSVIHSTTELHSKSLPLFLAAVSQSTSHPSLSNTDGQSLSVAFSQSTSHPSLSNTDGQSLSAAFSQSTSHHSLSNTDGQSLSAALSQSTSHHSLSNTDGQSLSAALSQSTSHHSLSNTDGLSLSAALSQSTSHHSLSNTDGLSLSGAIFAQSSPHVSLAFTDFQQNVAERRAISQLEHKFFQYIVCKHSLLDKQSPLLFHFHQFLCTTSNNYQPTEKSNLTYLDILNKHADSKETILTVLELLEGKYNVLRGMSDYLIVVGDAKTFNHLVSLKREQSEKFA